jgi:hypothetical protein
MFKPAGFFGTNLQRLTLFLEIRIPAAAETTNYVMFF